VVEATPHPRPLSRKGREERRVEKPGGLQG
jgi:hypothetical protein